MEQLGSVMLKLGIEGGTYWKWADETNDPKWTDPASVVKQRGLAFAFNPQERELADLYGFHLTNISNGSFEDGSTGWKVAGDADARPLDTNASWRGRSFLRLNGTATSPRIRVSPKTRCTTVAHLRFTAPANVAFRYFTCNHKASAKRRVDTFRLATAASSFQTFPFVYTTPADACWVEIRLSDAKVMDIDALR